MSKIPDSQGLNAVRTEVTGASNSSANNTANNTATAVRYLLQKLAQKAPGKMVEVRVPPYGAVQCRSGVSHRRGLPGNQVEAEPAAFVQLACGLLSWQEALESGQVRASGVHACLEEILPIIDPAQL